jgi:hypothetical protein
VVVVVVVVLTVLLILILIGGFVAYKKKVAIPGLDRLQGFVNPNYRSSQGDTGMVSCHTATPIPTPSGKPEGTVGQAVVTAEDELEAVKQPHTVFSGSNR